MTPRPPQIVIDWEQVPSTIDNPYWTLVRSYVTSSPDRTWGTFTVGSLDSEDVDVFTKRAEWVSAFSWAITDPPTVDFVAQNCTARVIDPMAGTGYWAYLLGQLGKRVIATDLNPPQRGNEINHWYRDTDTFVPVLQADARHAAAMSDLGDTLLLSWPPYDDPIGFETLSAFGGNRLIYIGEGEGGCTGDDALHALMASEWIPLDEHSPVQYFGIHDFVTVYDRNRPAGHS